MGEPELNEYSECFGQSYEIPFNAIEMTPLLAKVAQNPRIPLLFGQWSRLVKCPIGLYYEFEGCVRRRSGEEGFTEVGGGKGWGVESAHKVFNGF